MALQEVADHGQVELGLVLEDREVARLAEDDEFTVGDAVGQGSAAPLRGQLVVPPAEHEGRDCDLAQAVGDVEVRLWSSAHELVRSPECVGGSHLRHVLGGDLRELGARAGRVVGTRAVEMPGVELRDRILVFRIVEGAGVLVLQHGGVHLPSEGYPVIGDVEEIVLATCVRVGEDERLDLRGMVEGVGESQHAAPRLPVERDLTQAELAAHGLEFLDEASDLPQRGIVGPVGVATAKLVVEDELCVVVDDLVEAGEILRTDSGTAVQPDQRAPAGAVDLVGDLEATLDCEPPLTPQRRRHGMRVPDLHGVLPGSWVLERISE